jgi:hypothetical protein
MYVPKMSLHTYGLAMRESYMCNEFSVSRILDVTVIGKEL